VDFHIQDTCIQIGAQVCFGGAYFLDEGAGFVAVVLSQRFADDVGQGGFGAVGDDFEDVDEVFAAVGELLETVFFGEIFDLYVFGGLPTLGFEFSYFPDFLLDLLAQGGGFLDVLLYFPGCGLFFEDETTRFPLFPSELRGSIACFY
jgi:hypothetical protein